MKKIISLIAIIALLAGCSVHGSAKVGGGGFCPPGQAKKGNC